MNVASLWIIFVVLSTHKVGWSKKFHYPRAFYWSRTHVTPLSVRASQIGPVPLINEVIREWTNWTEWKPCSRTCGGGITSRTRSCSSKSIRVMPGSGIRTTHSRCSGDAVQYRVCRSDSCPADKISAVSFRDAQCRVYNNRKVLGRIVNNWIPYKQGGLHPCVLVCEGKGEGIVYTFGKVTDGTDCGSGGRQKGLCVNGRCMTLACDGRLGGTAEEDMCRVCGGHNDTCTKYSGVYHSELPSADQPEPGRSPRKTKSFGYYEVTEIPRGSTNIQVFDNSSNFIALKSGNKYLLNGNWLIDWPGDIEAAGTTFSYAREENQSEALATLGPTHEPLMLMVLLKEHNPGIRYEYWTPRHSRREKSYISGKQAHSRNLSPLLHHPARIRNNKSATRQHKNRRKPASLKVASLLNNSEKESRSKYEASLRNEIFQYRRLHKSKKKKHYKNRRSKVKRRKHCRPCQRPRAKESFCKSDFVSKVRVISKERFANESRVAVLVHQSYKNVIPLLHKEYLWQDACACRVLRPNKSYVVMGTTVTQGKGRGEVRLVLRDDAYVRKFGSKVLSRVRRLRREELKLCRKWRPQPSGARRLSSRNFAKPAAASFRPSNDSHSG